MPWQIKCIKQGSSIELGDYFRNKKKDTDFILHIGFWKDKKDNIIEEHTLLIDYKKWNNLFEFKYDDMLKSLLKNISNDKCDDNKWKRKCSEIKQLWNKMDRKIQLRFKRDHKKQKRIQCAINKKDFYDYFLRMFNNGEKTKR